MTCSAEEAIGQEERGFIEEEFGLDLAGKDAFVRIIVLAVITPADPHNRCRLTFTQMRSRVAVKPRFVPELD